MNGAPLFRLVLTERARPGSLMVDGMARRFVDEAANYNDVGRSLHDFDAAGFSFSRESSWLVFDAEYRRRYSLGPLGRGGTDPDWVVRADSLEELAEAIGAPPAALASTVERFNALAAAGVDDDFGRGAYAYDRFIGDGRAPNPTLRPLGDGPYYAVRVLPGCLGTKGGPRTDDRGRVLAADDSGPVPGPLRGRQRGGQPVRPGLPRGGGHDRSGPRLRPPRGRGRGGARCGLTTPVPLPSRRPDA